MTSNLSVFDITCNNLNVTDTLTVANTTYPSDIVYSINGESYFVYESFNSAVQSTIPVSVNLNNNSVSIIMNNSIRSNFDEFYCKVKDVMNAESRNFEVRFNSFIENVGGMI